MTLIGLRWVIGNEQEITDDGGAIAHITDVSKGEATSASSLLISETVTKI